MVDGKAESEKVAIDDEAAKEQLELGEQQSGKEEAGQEGKGLKFHAGDFKLKIKDQWRGKSQEELRREIQSQLKEEGLSDAPKEFVDQLARGVARELGKKTRSQNIKSLFRVSVLASVAITVASFASLMSQTAEKYVPREELRAALTNAILKDCDIDDIKLVYQNEVNIPAETIWPLVKPHLYYEKASLSLLTVLNDLKVLKLKSGDALDSKDVSFVSKVNILIAEHNKVNPFDGLDEQSLRDFRGISYKLNEVEYDKIQDELLNLNSAIKEKNSLIGQYLNSSNLSLYVSVAAFIFSIIVTLWQFLPNRKSSQKQLIAEAISEHMGKR